VIFNVILLEMNRNRGCLFDSNPALDGEPNLLPLLSASAISGRDLMVELVVNPPVQPNRLQTEGVPPFWNHRHCD